MFTKSIFTSKVFWKSIVLAILAVIAVFMEAEWLQDNKTIIAILLVADQFLNVILRYLTTVPVFLTGNRESIQSYNNRQNAKP